MRRMVRSHRWIPVILTCLFALALCGCEGGDARKSVTDTVKDLAGKQVIEKGDRMKQDIDRAMKDEARRLLRMGERKKGGNPEGEEENGGKSASD